MHIDDIIAHTVSLDAVITLQPSRGDGSPEISWGDTFFYFAPDGEVPATQPFATVVTKDYPDEPPSGLGENGTFRLNIAVPRTDFARMIGASPREALRASYDPRMRDAWFPHPVYGRAGWLSVVNPDTQLAAAFGLLEVAHQAARARHER